MRRGIYRRAGKSAFFVLVVFLLILLARHYFENAYPFLAGGDDTEIYNTTRYKNTFLKAFTFEYLNSNGSNTYWVPVYNLLFLLFGNVYGKEALPYFVFTFVVHVLNFGLFYLLLRKLGIRWLVAGMSALLFLFFPYNISAAQWISSGFCHPVANLFILSSTIAYIQSRHKRSVAWQTLAALFYLLGCLSKSSAYFLVFMFIAYDLFADRRCQNARKNLLASVKGNSVFLLMSLPFVLIQIARMRMGWVNRVQGGLLLDPFVIMTRLMDFWRSIFWQGSISDPFVGAAVLTVTAAVLLGFILLSKDRLARFGILWTFIMGFSFAMIYLLNIHERTQRYLYTFSIGAFMFVSAVLNEVRGRSRLQTSFLAVPLVLLLIYLFPILRGLGL